VNQFGTGGIDHVASCVSMPSSVSTSPASMASAYWCASRATRPCPSERSTACWLWPGCCARAAVRARCSALLTAATETPSWAAASAAEKPSTSRRISAARCCGGSRCSITMKASSTLSLSSYLASGVTGALCDSHRSGYGSSQTGSVTAGSNSAPGELAGPNPTGSSRRDRCLVMSRAALVAMEYSHERTELRPSNAASPRQARNSALCAASSASCTEPSIR
jgi:hypothetical protein